MSTTTEQSLLRRYVQHGDENAFASLVDALGGLVFTQALRKTGDPSTAEEVTQNIFALLAQKGAALAEHPSLLAWVQKATHFQALRATAKERNRRRLMKVYQSEVDAHSSGNVSTMEAGAVPQDHLPLLDEALAALPEKDRQAVLLRFWRQEPYKRIAEALGTSSEACEKRVSRAVDRLGQYFRRRGRPVAGVALAAHISSASASTTLPPLLAARLTPAALKSVPTISSFHPLLILTLMKTKLPILVAAVFLFSLSGLTGWVAGRNHVKHPAMHPPSNGIAGGGLRPQKERENQSPLTPAAKASAELQSLAALLEQARLDLHAGDSLANERALARISKISLADMPAAMEIIRRGRGLETDAALVRALASHWATMDGAAACDFVLTLKGPRMSIHPIREPLTVWAARDPQAALAWFRQNSSEKNPLAVKSNAEWMPISNIRWIFGQWGLVDAAGAIQAVSSLDGKTELAGALTGLGEAAGTMKQRPAMLDALLAKLGGPKDGLGPWQDLRYLLDRWSSHQPQELAAWLDAQPISKSSASMVAQPVLTAWLGEDPAAAVAWWMQREPGHAEPAHRQETLLEAWSKADAFAAAEWLAQQPPSVENAAATAVLVGRLTDLDPERAFQWARRIITESHRKEAMAKAYAAWNTKSPTEAQQALQGFSEEEKAALLK